MSTKVLQNKIKHFKFKLAELKIRQSNSSTTNEVSLAEIIKFVK